MTGHNKLPSRGLLSIFRFPTPKNDWILYNNAKSLTCKWISKQGITCHFNLEASALNTDT